jgi:mannan endo-1,4-beta-mannosidase
MFAALGAETALAAEFSGQGFDFSLPEGYEAEEKADLDDGVLSIYGLQATLKVYRQPLKGGVSAATYIEYSNMQLYQGKAGFKVLTNITSTVSGYRIREIGYTRPLITRIEDRNFYFEAHLIDASKSVVITFWGKTTQGNYTGLKKDIQAAVRSFRWEKQQNAKGFRAPTDGSGQASDAEAAATGTPATEAARLTPLSWGRFYPGAPERADVYTKMLETEDSLEHKFELLMTYTAFPDSPVYPAEAIRKVYADGRRLMLTLQPFTSDLNWIAVPEIIEGKHDRKIQEWAESLAEIGEPIFVRPLNEMNGDWDPWCSWFFGKDNELYILAWQHIVNVFRASGADNVLFVWNPHDRSYPDFLWNNAHQYYPGDAYVDWVGLTGYNNGTSHPGDVWREFDAIYQPLYADYLKRYADKPFMITEFSCNEEGGNKAAWIEKAMQSLAKNYPQIKIAVWFDRQDNKWLYQLDSSPAAFEAFKQGLSKL